LSSLMLPEEELDMADIPLSTEPPMTATDEALEKPLSTTQGATVPGALPEPPLTPMLALVNFWFL
jgi:hypothetical protein